ncbi:glucokinase [Sphingomonas sp.]|jgi:glucokinase|uniref:glucokinase n=1 Tax=Sphingomonas sp. TaxID=28214 RepID=UPI002E322860|nr:glucokinase [Sphingomonas sp.]HEX4693667.1 glucokinase [Sphingomonas sp.]
MEVVAVDIGGTHARFAIAEVADGKVVSLGQAITQNTAEHASLQTAWQDFGRRLGRQLPKAAAIAVASPVGGEVIKLTNNPWIVRPALIPERLGADTYVIVNDFGAIAHAVAQLPDADFLHICGPDRPLARDGVTSICGPGTGLGVAAVLHAGGTYHVLATEGGHVDFAPLDSFEDAMLKRLRKTFTRVSAERVCAGPAIVAIYETLAEIEGKAVRHLDDKAIWQLAFEGSESLAIAALDRFVLALGAFAGDLALMQGAKEVVLAGGLGLKLKAHFARSGFAERFTAKGRFRQMMADIPVKLITHPQPGLYGAAAAFARQYSRQA